MARASAFQAEGRGFESRLPLHFLPMTTWLRQDCHDGQGALRFPPAPPVSPIATWLRQDMERGAPAPLCPATSTSNSDIPGNVVVIVDYETIASLILFTVDRLCSLWKRVL